MIGFCECGCGERTEPYTQTRRGHKAGELRRFVNGHNNKGRQITSLYRRVNYNGRMMRMHQMRAERALGRPLPKGAVIHHADGSRGDDAPLVICQDAAYHRLLHVRMRVKAAGGNPNTDKICWFCKQVKPKSEYNKHRSHSGGLSPGCRSCSRAYNAVRLSLG